MSDLAATNCGCGCDCNSGGNGCNIIWLILILLGTLVGMVALQTIWSGLSALWSAVRILIP